MKMLPEEKDCRDFVRAAIQNDCDKPTAAKLITALIRAVRLAERERCAKVVIAQRTLVAADWVRGAIAAAIRGKK